MSTFRHLPKIGFSNHRFKRTYQVVNLEEIEKRGLEGEIGPEELRRAGLIKKATGRVKVLGAGELSRGLTLRAHKFSRSALEKIELAGGKAEVI